MLTRREIVAHWRVDEDTVFAVHKYRRRWWLFGEWVLTTKQNYRGDICWYAYPQGWRVPWELENWLQENLQRIEYEQGR